MTEPFIRVLEACNHLVKDGTRHMWDCYGPAAHIITCEFGTHATAEMVYSTADRQVFEVTVWFEDERDNAYRWIHPDFKEAFVAEADDREVDPKEAWEGVRWADTDSFDDIVEKLAAIADDREFDPRVVITFDIAEEVFNAIAWKAHQRDITFNAMIEECLKAVIIEHGGSVDGIETISTQKPIDAKP